MSEARKIMVYEYTHCPFCGSTDITHTKETYNYKAGFWGLIFLNALGMFLFGFLCRKRTICHCHECGSLFSYYDEEVV